MDFFKTDPDRLQVLISEEEQDFYGVKMENIKKSDLSARRLCETILQQASQNNLFIRRSNILTVKARQTPQGLTLWIENGENTTNKEYLYQTVRYPDIDSLLDSLPLFKKHETEFIYSSLYRYQSCYFLYFEIYTTHAKALSFLYDVLEYAEKTAVFPCVLKEHGETLLKDDALSHLIGQTCTSVKSNPPEEV